MDVQIGDEMVNPTGEYRLIILGVYEYQWTLFGGDPNHRLCKEKSAQSPNLLDRDYWERDGWKISVESRIDRLLKKYNNGT